MTTTIDTSSLSLDEVAAEVLAWAPAALRGETLPPSVSAAS